MISTDSYFSLLLVLFIVVGVEATDYFVGKSGCDDNGPGTSNSQPFCKVQTGLDVLSAGDTLTIGNGVYNERCFLHESGTEGNPITIKGESTNAIIDAGCTTFPCDWRLGPTFYNSFWEENMYSGFFIALADHVVLDGFTVRNAPLQGIELLITKGIKVQNMVVQNAGDSLINMYDSSDFQFLYNTLSGGNLGQILLDGTVKVISSEEALTVVNSTNFEIAYNHVSRGLKEAIDVKVYSRNGIVHDNFIDYHCRVGIYINEAFEIQVYKNRITNMGFFQDEGGTVSRCDDLLSTEYDYEPGVGILLAVGDLGDDLNMGLLSDISIYQNVIYNTNVGCLELWDELVSSGTGEGTLTDVKAFNNVFYNCNRSKTSYGPGVIVASSVVNLQVDNNIIDGASDALLVEVGATFSASNNLIHQAGSGPFGSNAILLDPMFVDPASADFTLQASSPAIDAGKDVGLDFLCNAPDIGAFEFTGCTAPPPPPGKEPGEGACFSGETKVQVLDTRDVILMKDLRIGDYVKTSRNNFFERVYSFGHYSPSATQTMLVLNDKLVLSPDHLVYVRNRGGFIPASMVKVEDQLLSSSQEVVTVTKISRKQSQGLFAPFTSSGTLYVNDVLVSSFVAIQKDTATLRVGPYNTYLTYHWLGLAFELPHRIACQVGLCISETYTSHGLSTWVAAPYEIASRWLKQDHWFQMLTLPLIVMPLLLLGLLSSSGVGVALGASVAFSHAGFRKKMA